MVADRVIGILVGPVGIAGAPAGIVVAVILKGPFVVDAQEGAGAVISEVAFEEAGMGPCRSGGPPSPLMATRTISSLIGCPIR